MPKIYGSAKADKNGIFTCSICGYRWKGNQEELEEVKKKHKVSCLMCRAMNNLRVGQIIPKNPNFKVGKYANGDNPDSLRGDNYQDQNITLVHTRCRGSFEAKLSDVRTGNIVCPHCKKYVKKIVKHPMYSKDKEKSDEHINKQLNNTLTEIIEKAPDLAEHMIEKVSSKDLVKNNLGKLIGENSRLVDINEANDTCTIQCIKCGSEETRSLSMIKKSKNKEKLLTCDRCLKSGEPEIESLKREYLGRIYNGLRIEEVYKDESGIVLCDVVCTQNIRNQTLKEYVLTQNKKKKDLTEVVRYGEMFKTLHIQKGLPLGDVVNRRIYCDICGKKLISDAPRFKNAMNCPILDEKKIAFDTGKMTVEDFYKQGKTGFMCDSCKFASKCLARRKEFVTSMSFISTKLDMEDSLINDVLSINASYPGMFEFSDVNDVSPKAESELIIIKEAYIGRDGKMYRTCKCRKHNKEMVLSDSEIASFNHEQCNINNAHMRFFDLTRKFYLNTTSDEDKKK